MNEIFTAPGRVGMLLLLTGFAAGFPPILAASQWTLQSVEIAIDKASVTQRLSEMAGIEKQGLQHDDDFIVTSGV